MSGLLGEPEAPGAGPKLLSVSDRGAVAGFRTALAAASFTSASIKELVGSELDGFPLWPMCVPAVLRRLQGSQPLSTLVKLFVLGMPVDRQEAARALAPLGPEECAELGVVNTDGHMVEASVRLVPSGGLLLACDFQRGLSPVRDQVMGVLPSSVLLSHLTVRQQVESALDLGTGGGVQALLAAPHAGRVVATDLSSRAMAFAAFNCELNGVSNVELREGNLFEPVAGMTFDLVVSNPPFVISPDNDVLFRDGGQRGDALSRQLVTELPEYLSEGGIAELLVSWGHRRDEHWSVPVTRWVRGNGCDAWILHHATRSAPRHAAIWTKHLEPDATAHRSAFNRWVDYLEEEEIEAVSIGAVILRRRTGDNWLRLDDLGDRQISPAADQVVRLIDAQDRAAAWSPRKGLLECRFRPGSDYRLEPVLRTSAGAYATERWSLALEGGLGTRYDIEAFEARLLEQVDGRRSLGEALAAAGCGPITYEELLRVAREMIRLGVLVPAEEDI